MKMGKYTILRDPRVDKYIDLYLERVVEALLAKMQGIRSIILGGSYGKGEGSVLVDGKSVKPLRDFDIWVIFGERRSRDPFVEKIERELRERFATASDQDYYLTGDLIPEIHATTLESINSLPDITTYDLKKCRLLYGEDIRPKVKWDLKDLPLRTNARALFQKAIAMIGAFHSEYLKNEIPAGLRASFLRETSRAYIEICTGLCLLAHRYDTSSIRRMEIVREIYKKQFHDLYEKIPDLVDKIETSTKHRIDPANNVICADPLDYWFETRKDLGEAIKYYFSKYLSLRFENWIQFSASLEKSLTREYYLPVIKAFLENRNLPSRRLLVGCLNLLFNIKVNLDYSRAAATAGRFSMPLLNGVSSPAIRVFSTAPLILFAFTHSGRTNFEYVEIALKKLSFVKTDERRDVNGWDEARLKFLRLVFSVNLI
jgi:predicted nucleotidyltransferase